MFGDDLRWENRRLVSGFGNEYKYNADGLRVSKNNSKKSTEYYIVDGTYIGEVTQIGNQKFVITYLYGTDGIAGIDINGTPYYFVKNLQGDVTGILDANGNVVGTYQYDAYGVITAIYNKYGYNILYRGGYETDVISLNPFRYRGYMFDSEAELYYLHSRYYDPWTGRFLNADVMVSTGQDFDGNNMFVYCLNNPVNNYDSSGMKCICSTRRVNTKHHVCNSEQSKTTQPIKQTTTGHSSSDDLTSQQMHDNATIIYNQLSDTGWSHNAICATLGNMQHESVTINPGRGEDGGGGGYGLVQWTPASKYLDWASQNNYKKDSLPGQVEFLVYSMQPGQGEWLNNSNAYLSYDQFIHSDASVAYLTEVFMWSYERPGVPHLDRRIECAEYWSNYFS